MSYKQEKGRPILKRNWVRALIAFIVLQLILIICDRNGWSLNVRDIDGTIFDRVSKSQVFTEWFAPYNNSLFNIFAAFFTIILLPYVIINAIKDLFSKKQTNNHAG